MADRRRRNDELLLRWLGDADLIAAAPVAGAVLARVNRWFGSEACRAGGRVLVLMGAVAWIRCALPARIRPGRGPGAPRSGGARAGSQTRAGTERSADSRLERSVATGLSTRFYAARLAVDVPGPGGARSVGRFVGWAKRAVNRPAAHAQS